MNPTPTPPTEKCCEESYERGQQNPRVGFLRQYLNESPDWKGSTWTDEEIIRFLRIPFTNQPS